MVSNAVPGPATGYDLTDLTPLTAPRRLDAWGCLRPQATRGFLCLSAELASSAYSMQMEPWLRAGWQDITLQVDGALTAVTPKDPGAGRGLTRLMRSMRLQRVYKQLEKPGPLGEMLGAVRQIRTSNTGKALVMLHPLADGRYVVAIGFTGTGRRLYDWFSNLRMMADNGFHRGFMQLEQQFEHNETAIQFPHTAARLGLEKLTLSSIIAECCHTDSRFLLWTAGHSQGGAVMQVWVHNKLMELGVLPQNLLGCGFASPSAVEGTAVMHPERYPLLHVINSDDVIPHMGAMMHLGQVLTYRTDEALRQHCYRMPTAPEDLLGRAAARQVLCQMRNTPDCLVLLAACLRLLQQHPVNEVAEMLGHLQSSAMTRTLYAAMDARVESVLYVLEKRCAQAYRSVTDKPMPMQQVQRMMRRIHSAARQVGMKPLLAGMAQLSGAAHSMYGTAEPLTGAYAYIAATAADRLTKAVWLPGELPALIPEKLETTITTVHTMPASRRVRAVPHRHVPRTRRG